MRLVLRNYLYSLKEDGELDKICVEMLEDMGLTVHSSAQKGTRQYGVDVLAHGIMLDDDTEKVYALIIKCKDIDRVEFERERTGVRASIKECLEVYTKNCLPEKCRSLPIVLCIVCGGEIKFEVRENLTALVKDEFDWYRKRHGSNLECEEWTGDKLASMLQNSLQNSNLLVNGDKRLFFRSLSLAQEPQESFRAFKVFVNQILDFKRIKQKTHRLKVLREVNLSLAMLIHECADDEVKNYEAAWLSAEYVYLKEWEYIRKCKEENEYDGKFDSALVDVARMYCKVAEAYIDRINIFAKERYGFSLAVDGSDELDVVLKFYDVLGKVSSFGLYLLECKGVFCVCDGGDSVEDRFRDVRGKVLGIILNMLTHNPIAAKPILDSQSRSIICTIRYLLLEGKKNVVFEWLETLVSEIRYSFNQGYGYIVNDVGYEDLLEHLHAPIMDKKVEEMLKSSELLPSLAIVALRIERMDIYDDICELVMSLSRKIDYQMWFLDEESEKDFYSGNYLCGSQLCSLNIEDYEDFIATIEAERSASPINLSCNGTQHSGLLYVGCRHYGFPLPGNIFCDDFLKGKI